MKIRCVVSCRRFDGVPDFYFCIVECTPTQFYAGDHYDAAQAKAREEGYEDCQVVYDQNDGPNWLFDHFVWESASTVKVGN
jgi:hypothetical protein